MTHWRRALLTTALLANLAFVSMIAAQDATPVPAQQATLVDAGPTTSENTTVGDAGDGSATDTEAGVTAEGATNEAAEAVAVAEASSNPLVPLGINLGFLCFQTLNFLLVFLLLRALVWKPLMNMLDNRAVTVQRGLEDAAAAATARRNAETEAQGVVAAARGDVNKVVEEGRTRADAIAKQIEAEARAEAENIRAEARTRSEEERNRQLGEMRTQVGTIAMAVSRQLIGESLDEKRQRQLINDFFTKIPAEARNMGGGAVEVISAMGLSDEEKQLVRKEIGSQDVTFLTDTNILGGLIVRSNDRVIDGSVRNDLDRLSSQLR